MYIVSGVVGDVNLMSVERRGGSEGGREGWCLLYYVRQPEESLTTHHHPSNEDWRPVVSVTRAGQPAEPSNT